MMTAPFTADRRDDVVLVGLFCATALAAVDVRPPGRPPGSRRLDAVAENRAVLPEGR